MNMGIRKGLWGLMLKTNAAFRTYQRNVRPAPIAPPTPPAPAAQQQPQQEGEQQQAAAAGPSRRAGWRATAWGLLSSAASAAKVLVAEVCEAAVAAGRCVAKAHAAMWAFASNAQWAMAARVSGLWRPLLGRSGGGHELNARNLRYLQALQQQQALQLTPVYNWPAPQQLQQQQQQQQQAGGARGGGGRADSVASSRPSSRSGARPAGPSELLMWVPTGRACPWRRQACLAPRLPCCWPGPHCASRRRGG
jgi:hypothetical protein